MNLALSEDQQAIERAIDRLMADRFPRSTIRRLGTASGGKIPNDSVWSECAQAGWLGLGLPAELGGAGLGAAEEVLLFRRIGRNLVPGPLLGTVIAGHLAAICSADDLAAELASGERRCGVAVGDIGLDAEVGQLVVSLDGHSAVLCTVRAATATAGVDPAVATCRLVLSDCVLRTGDPLVLARARLLVAAAALGVLDAVCDMSATYARQRVQFGVPIGTFQAVKHRCADMAVAAYATAALVNFSARRLDASEPDASFQAACAHLVATASASRAAADNIQNHGAIGFTMEHDAHLFLRRAHTLGHTLGDIRLTAADILEPERHEFA
jgi:alkylation response protein AidB-like acyl-CoA dehydrogenase